MDEAKQTHEPFFTVIVPVYKAEAYLEDSIKSVLDQTFGDFELWLVDDGSPDNSGKICDEIAARDSRVHVHHQQNAGPSAARNYGLEHAKGQYVCFMDADDRVKPDWLEVYHQHADADILIQGVEVIGKDGKVTVIRAADKVYRMEGRGKSELVEEIYDTCISSVWPKSFNRQLIASNNIRFNESICRGEDRVFSVNCYSVCKTVRNIDCVTYCYQTENSLLSRNIYDIKYFIYTENYAIEAFESFMINNKELLAYRLYFAHAFICLFHRFFYTVPTTPRSTRILAYQWIRKYIRYADFSQYGWRQQVFRLLWLPDWLFDIVLLGVTGSCAVARAVVPKGVRRALKKAYHALWRKKGSAS